MYRSLIYLISAMMLLFVSPLFSQDDEMDDHNLEAMTKLANPNLNHDLLKQLTGEWTIQWEHHYSHDSEPLTGTGESKNEMILGGRFLQLNGTTKFMNEKKNILQFIGFDNRLEYYFLIGMDEFGTYAIFAEGEYISEERKWAFFGVDLDPTGTEEFPYRIEISLIDKDKFIMETYIGEEENELKAMSVTYSKKK
jgi:hypothetical protein